MSEKRASDALPESVVVGPNQRFQVLEVDEIEGGALGRVDLGKGVILVRRDMPYVGKLTILIHELIHVADHKARLGDCYRRKLSEDQVTNLAGTLFPMLALSGLVAGVGEAEVLDFLAS